MGLLARIIEEVGVPTIYVGSARDMMEQVKPPRSVFVNFPLGHRYGKPFDQKVQMSIIKDALQVLTTLDEPGTIVDLPYEWGEDFGFSSEERGYQLPADQQPPGRVLDS